MKTLSFIAALAIAASAFAQEPAPEEKPAPPAPADAAPAPAEEAPAPADAPKLPEQASPDLPLLPEPAPGSEQADILRNAPGGRLTPAPVAIPGSKKNENPERIIGKSTLRPPATSQELEARIAYRQARAKAEGDPKLRAIWDESRIVDTDNEKRELLKEYYNGLYAKMLSYDKSITSLVELRRRYALRRLAQNRVDPSLPLEDARVIGNY